MEQNGHHGRSQSMRACILHPLRHRPLLLTIHPREPGPDEAPLPAGRGETCVADRSTHAHCPLCHVKLPDDDRDDRAPRLRRPDHAPSFSLRIR